MDTIFLEEQQSNNPKISKLLNGASKKGAGKGYPEFIITCKTNLDLLIVIECKAEITNPIKIESTEKLVPLDFLFTVYNGLPSSEVDVLEVPESDDDIRYIRPSQTYEGTTAGYVNKLFNEVFSEWKKIIK